MWPAPWLNLDLRGLEPVCFAFWGALILGFVCLRPRLSRGRPVPPEEDLRQQLARVQGEHARAAAVYRKRLAHARTQKIRHQRQLRRNYLQLTQTLARLQKKDQVQEKTRDSQKPGGGLATLS